MSDGLQITRKGRVVACLTEILRRISWRKEEKQRIICQDIFCVPVDIGHLPNRVQEYYRLALLHAVADPCITIGKWTPAL